MHFMQTKRLRDSKYIDCLKIIYSEHFIFQNIQVYIMFYIIMAGT